MVQQLSEVPVKRIKYDDLWTMTGEEWAKRVDVTQADKEWMTQFAFSKKQQGPLHNPEIFGGHKSEPKEDGSYPESEWDQEDKAWDERWGVPIVDVKPRWLIREACVALAEAYWKGDGVTRSRGKAVGLIYPHVPSNCNRILALQNWKSQDEVEAIIVECRGFSGAFGPFALSHILERVGNELWGRSLTLMRHLHPPSTKELRALQRAFDTAFATGREDWFREMAGLGRIDIQQQALKLWESALALAQRAVDLGNPEAAFGLFRWTFQEPPEPPEADMRRVQRALKALEFGAGIGHCEAQVWMGDLHYTGLWQVPRDFQRSAEWFKRALGEQRDSDGVSEHTRKAQENTWEVVHARCEAAYSLGYLYLYGQGVGKDKAKAREYFSRSVEFGGFHDEDSQKALRYLQPLKWMDRLVRLQPPGRKWRTFLEERSQSPVSPSVRGSDAGRIAPLGGALWVSAILAILALLFEVSLGRCVLLFASVFCIVYFLLVMLNRSHSGQR